MSADKNGEEVLDFVSRLSSEKVCIVWRINNFTVDKGIPGRVMESPQFWFSNANWKLELYPKGKQKAEFIALFLKCSTPTEAIVSLKGKFQFIGALDEIVSREFSETRNWKIGFGYPKFLSRDTFMKRLDEFLSPNKTLIVKCEVNLDKESSHALTSGISAAQSHFSLSVDESFMKNTFGTMFKSTSFSDVVLRVDGTDIAAHKIILCNRSKIFKAMLENDMKEKRDNVIDLKEMDVCVATEMLRYIYTENVNALPFPKTQELYSVADRYELQDLRDKCRHFMMEHLSATNVCDVIALADLHSDIDLAKIGREYFANNIRNVLKLETWMTLEKLKPEFCFNLLRNSIKSNIVI